MEGCTDEYSLTSRRPAEDRRELLYLMWTSYDLNPVIP